MRREAESLRAPLRVAAKRALRKICQTLCVPPKMSDPTPRAGNRRRQRHRPGGRPGVRTGGADVLLSYLNEESDDEASHVSGATVAVTGGKPII